MYLSEADAARLISSDYAAHLTFSDDVNNLVRTWLTPDQEIEGDEAELTALVGLLSKSVRLHRGIRLLCERGLGDEAETLNRSLYEAQIAVSFITTPNLALPDPSRPKGDTTTTVTLSSRERAFLYLAYQQVSAYRRALRTFDEADLNDTPLEKAYLEYIDQARNHLGTGWEKAWKRSYSGLSLADLAKLLGGEDTHNRVYPLQSFGAHATDGQRYTAHEDGRVVPVLGCSSPRDAKITMLTLGSSSGFLLFSAEQADRHLGIGQADEFASKLQPLTALRQTIDL